MFMSHFVAVDVEITFFMLCLYYFSSCEVTVLGSRQDTLSAWGHRVIINASWHHSSAEIVLKAWCLLIVIGFSVMCQFLVIFKINVIFFNTSYFYCFQFPYPFMNSTLKQAVIHMHITVHALYSILCIPKCAVLLWSCEVLPMHSYPGHLMRRWAGEHPSRVKVVSAVMYKNISLPHSRTDSL